MHASQIDRRSGKDRRALSVGAFWQGALMPRRKRGRRASDQVYPIIDWHSPRVFAWALAALVLCVADGVLTVFLMQHGAIELNPVMAMFLPHRLEWFAAVKLLLTGTGMIVLVACSQMKLFRWIRGEVLLALTFLSYLTLVIYELHLVSQIH